MLYLMCTASGTDSTKDNLVNLYNVFDTLVSIIVVTLRWARLVPGWVTVFGRGNYLGI